MIDIERMVHERATELRGIALALGATSGYVEDMAQSLRHEVDDLEDPEARDQASLLRHAVHRLTDSLGCIARCAERIQERCQ